MAALPPSFSPPFDTPGGPRVSCLEPHCGRSVYVRFAARHARSHVVPPPPPAPLPVLPPGSVLVPGVNGISPSAVIPVPPLNLGSGLYPALLVLQLPPASPIPPPPATSPDTAEEMEELHEEVGRLCGELRAAMDRISALTAQ